MVKKAVNKLDYLFFMFFSLFRNVFVDQRISSFSAFHQEDNLQRHMASHKHHHHQHQQQPQQQPQQKQQQQQPQQKQQQPKNSKQNIIISEDDPLKIKIPKKLIGMKTSQPIEDVSKQINFG